MSMHLSVRALLEQIESYEQHRLSSLRLVASENLMSPLARRVAASDLGHRYCIPPVDERPPEIWEYPDQVQLREIQKITEKLGAQLFHGERCDVRPLSGNGAAAILLDVMTPEDVVASVPADCGGHFATDVILANRGVKRVDLVYDGSRGEIDVGRSAVRCRAAGVTHVFLDASTLLFPHPLQALRELLPEVTITYDASHTMGLIAGGAFQTPLREGANILQGSTHKSLFGPQKGLFVFREESPFSARVQERVCPHFVSNTHVHHIAALGVAFAELEAFGAEYAQQVVDNARALGASLHQAGESVLLADRGFTRSHQVVWTIGDRLTAEAVFCDLESVNLHTNLIRIPYQSRPAFGFRLGVSELTRRGAKEQDMREIGGLLSKVRQKGSSEGIRKRVESISRRWPSVHYSFDAQTAAESRGTAVLGAP